jgi:hypothetical protein
VAHAMRVEGLAVTYDSTLFRRVIFAVEESAQAHVSANGTAVEVASPGATLAEVLAPFGSPDVLRRLLLFVDGTLTRDLTSPLSPDSEVFVTMAFSFG